MKITTIGIDLAKNVFQVHGVDERGKAGLKKQLKRAQVLPFFANCGAVSDRHGGLCQRAFLGAQAATLGHTVKLMAPQYVKPYVKSNKNDAVDAEAICEAVGRPNMRFVAVKTAEQQAILAVHRARQGSVKARTAQANQIRGFLGEFGVVMPQGISQIAQRCRTLWRMVTTDCPAAFGSCWPAWASNCSTWIGRWAHWRATIVRWHQDSEASRRLAQIPGIGPLGASALLATVGDAPDVRPRAASIGMAGDGASPSVERGQGDVAGHEQARRQLPAHAAHPRRPLGAAASRAPTRAAEPWLKQLLARRPKNVVAVALANKNARIAWALLAHDRDYQVPA